MGSVQFAIDNVKALVPIWKKEVYGGPYSEPQGEEGGDGRLEGSRALMPDHQMPGADARSDGAAMETPAGELADGIVIESDSRTPPPPSTQWKANKEWDVTRAVEFSQRTES